MKKEELFELTTFVDSDTFGRIANGEQNEVLRVLYPSNREIFITKDDGGEEVELVGYNAIRIVDITKGLEMLCEIIDCRIITLTADDGETYSYVIRGKEYTPEALVYELGNTIQIEENGTDN